MKMISALEYLRLYNSEFGDQFEPNFLAWVFSLFFRDSESDDVGSEHFDNLLNHDDNNDFISIIKMNFSNTKTLSKLHISV